MDERISARPEADERALITTPRRTLRSTVPITSWLPTYRWRDQFPADLIAGIALAALLIPESMGYAGVAGVPPEVGLYAALGAILAYALSGGVSILVVGPASAVAALSASLVAEFGSDVDAVTLTAALALTSGLIYLVLGILRLGWIVNFISRPVLHAFIAGLSISIIVGQIDGLLGIEVEGESVLAKAIDIVRNVGDSDLLTVMIGVGSIVMLLVVERFAERIPAAVVVVVVGILLVVFFDLSAEGVAIVGEIPSGLPSIGVPDLSALRWLELVGAGVALVLVGFSESFASASATADGTGETVDADQELLATGGANVAAGLVGGLAVSGSLSKSAASQRAGAQTQMANVVCGFVVLGTLLFLAPVFERLPETVLAAIVIIAVIGSADPRRVLALWNVNRQDFIAATLTFVLVLVWETLPAMIVGVALSLVFTIRRSSFPDVVELRIDEDGELRRYDPDDLVVPGAVRDNLADVAFIRFEAPLIYSNAGRLLTAAETLLERRPGIRKLVLDGEMFSDLDSSGAETLQRLDELVTEAGAELHLARIHQRARSQIDRSHLADRFSERTHTSLRAAASPYLDEAPTEPGA